MSQHYTIQEKNMKKLLKKILVYLLDVYPSPLEGLQMCLHCVNFPVTMEACFGLNLCLKQSHHYSHQYSEHLQIWILCCGILKFNGEEEKVEHVHSQHLQTAQHFFPSCICAAVLPILHLLEDLEVNPDGMAVCQVAEKVIWSCLTEEPALFLRMFLEKLTIREKQEELIFLLRKLLYHMRELPPQTAHCLFNYLVGFIMFYVRSPTEGGQEAIGEALSILWKIVPSVQGIFFKDLKQTLRKEQCDPTLLVMANVPSAKKLIVHGPDLSSVPSQLPIHEDTQFEAILQDSLDFFNIPENEQDSYFLVDTKTHQMHNLNSYVRDFYFFRRNFYPQLSMVHMNPDDAFRALQKQALSLKFAEIGKVLFSMSVIAASQGQQIQNHVSFLHEELQKLPSFPRKALEADFGLYHAELGKEVYGVDNLHKYVWIKIISQMFKGLSSTTTGEGDLLLFLNVVNGVIILHAEDTALLRVSIACFINAARHFKQVFATSGFLMMMPTLMKVYSHHQANPVVLRAIEFACRQFFLLHRNPFMLQMFGSIAPILVPMSVISDGSDISDFEKVSPISLFKLLLALEKDVVDDLDILELVEGEKPLTALDFCYMDDVDTLTMLDTINMCVTVVAYACDSTRAVQMLTILEAIMPQHLKYLQNSTKREATTTAAKLELSAIGNLAVAMKALLSCADSLARNFSGPQRHLQAVNAQQKKASQNHHGNHSPPGMSVYYDEPSDIRFVHMEDGLNAKRNLNKHQNPDDSDLNLQEFRKPRNLLISIVAQFFTHSSNRIKYLKKVIPDSSVRIPELLDTKSHNRLADIVHVLLKIAPYDPGTMKCNGLKCYMVDVLPHVDWAQESVRPALNLLLRRLERLFSKLYKKQWLRRQLDWESAANILKGVYTTLAKYLFVAHLPHLKTLINVCLNIILSDEGGVLNMDGLPLGMSHRNSETAPPKIGAPPVFCAAVIKLTAMQMQALGAQFTLETICGGMSVFPTTEKTIKMLLNLILPLCIRMGCGRRDSPKMKPGDISFAVSVVLHALVPPSKHTSGERCKMPLSGYNAVGAGSSDFGFRRMGSLTSNPTNRRVVQPKEIMQIVAFLGLKIIIVCFEKQLATEWYRIAQYIKEFGMIDQETGALPLWQFFDFIVTVKTPLYMMLVPFIQYKMMKTICKYKSDYFIPQMVHQKLQGCNLPYPKCKSTLLVELVTDMTQIREELVVSLVSEMRPRTATVGTERSDVSHRSSSIVGLPKSSSIHDLLEHQVQQKLNTLTPNIHAARLRAMRGIGASISTCSTVSYSNQVSPSIRPPVHPGVRRISAVEGHMILDKFMHNTNLPDEEMLPEESCLGSDGEDPHQSTSGIQEAAASTASAELEPRGHRLQRQDAKSRKTFKIKRHRSTIKSSMSRSATHKIRHGSSSGIVSHQPHQHDVNHMSGRATDHKATGKEDTAMYYNSKGGHSLSLDSQMEARANYSPASEEQSKTDSPLHLQNTSSSGQETEEGVSGDVGKTSPRRQLNSDSTATTTKPNGKAMTSELLAIGSLPDMTLSNGKSGRKSRYIAKSRSQDDGSSHHLPVGTARARIARHSPRNPRSRSPSNSPARYSEDSIEYSAEEAELVPKNSSTSLVNSQAYVVDCDSMESLTGESASLLKHEEKSPSQSSLLIYFDENDTNEGTCV